MKVLVAGASGVVGRALVPLLVGEGAEVVAVSRSDRGSAEFAALGVKTVTLDVFDREAVFDVVRGIRPDTVIHQLTSLGNRDFGEHARLRREGTRNLADASKEAGTRRMIAQSISWAYAGGDEPAAEEEALDLEAEPPRRTTVEAVAALESAVLEMPEAVILRYGLFYGPGTWYAADGFMADELRQGRLTATGGISSFVHVSDAANAAVAALRWPSGIYNIVDDEPAAATEWLPAFADAAGAPRPAETATRRADWERGASNRKAAELGWRPRFGSWRQGFATL